VRIALIAPPLVHHSPVIAWRNGSVPEVMADGRTGFIVESTEEMAAAMDRLGELDPGGAGPWGDGDPVQERFSAEAMVADYERAYAQALAGERAAASG
jgi:glycosyltransferase involved in cell wall biosynthesis